MTTALTFGSWLKRRRMGLGLTQKDLAQQVGYAAVTLRKVEADELRPSVQMAKKLAEALDLPPDEQAQFVRFARDEAQTDDIALPIQTALPHAAPPHAAPHAQAAATLPTYQTNLPAPLTTFVGRGQELAELVQVVVTHRLVTLTGAGGVGKTRLAVESGIRAMWDGAHGAFADGVWLVELASLAGGGRDAALVAQAIANLFKLSGPADRTSLELVQAALAPKHMLLILDNCEHLVQGCAEVAEALLHRCWRLHILATSREELRVAGEVVCPVLPLALPDPQERAPERVLSTAAAQLFVERMGTAPALRRMQEEDAAAIAHICRRLDGIPLALELAAPLTRSMGLAQIAEQLRDQMAILTTSYRTAIPRHQTMHSALVWSYRLLAPAEQQLLAQMSVFAGGWTLPACTAVSGAAAEESILLPLHQLVAKSFVLVEYGSGERRFRLLEPIRQFAHAQLAAAGDLEATRRRHAEYYLTLAEEMGTARDTPQEREHLQQLSPERDNLRAVNQWCLEHHAAEFAQRFNGLLFAYWVYASSSQEANYWLETALSLPQSEDLAARTPASLAAEASALDTAGYVAVLQLDFTRARAYFERELALCRKSGDQRGVAAAMRGIGFTAMHGGDLPQAQIHDEQALAVAQAAGDDWGCAWGLYDLGYLALVRGELRSAQSQLEEAVVRLREQGINFGLFRALLALGRVAKAQGDPQRAHGQFCAALRLQQVMGYTNHVAEGLEGVAGIAAQEGQTLMAARLFAAAHAHREATFWPRWRDQEADYAADLALARSGLAGRIWEENWALGCAMPLEDAVKLALAE